MAVVDPLSYQPHGDKKNSAFFEEYRLKVCERRKKAGVEDLLGNISAVVIQVETGDAFPYMEELYLMTPYRFLMGFLSNTHKIYFLKNRKLAPFYIILEPLAKDFADDMTYRNLLHPNSRLKPNARYVGEIFHTQNMKETQKILQSHDIRFHMPGETQNNFFNNEHFVFTTQSDYTGNRLGYMELDIENYADLQIGEQFQLTGQEKDKLAAAHQKQVDKGLHKIISGVDHLATRVLSGDREEALLEFLTMSNYYLWGAYNIKEMNSSTNVTRNGFAENELHSPAKVFTANNTPFIVNSFENLPMPTETFVRNYGRRMHHIAQHVIDGDHASGQKNIDYVVSVLQKEFEVEFLAHIVGECKDQPDLKQIFSRHSEYSLLITEYIQRCHRYRGFFTKQNVSSLTEAAGADESLETALKKVGAVFD